MDFQATQLQNCYSNEFQNITITWIVGVIDMKPVLNDKLVESDILSSAEDVRDAALRLYVTEEEKRRLDPEKTRERSIIIIGSKNVGKTAMIYRFLEKDEVPKPTIGMDYSFGRKTGKSLMKSIVHVWEVGYLSSSLVSAAMIGSTLTHAPHHTTILIMLDLSQPESLWSSFEECFSVVKSGLRMSYAENTIQDMREKRVNGEKRHLEEGVDPFPLNLCIIGGKYDEFKELEEPKKELVGKVLRAIAHSLGAGLHYHSSKDKVLVRKTKDLLSHYGFGGQLPETKQTDFRKPLSITSMADSFSLIDLEFPQTRPSTLLDTIKQIYISQVPQVARNNEIILEDPSNDANFNEPIIDRLRTQREEEINVLLHDMLEGLTPQIPVPDPS